MPRPVVSSLRLRRSLPVLACILGLSLAAAPSAGAATSPALSRAARAEATARAAIRRLDAIRPAGHLSRGARPDLTKVESTNWSGYADTGTGFTQVSGDWKEPTVSTCGTATSYAAFWIGLDGYSSPTVEQEGTMIECYQGTAYQYSWWGLYPDNDLQIEGSNVKSGDSITALIQRTGTKYAFTLTDSTHPASSFSTTQTCAACDNTSAEWITETMDDSPLSHFGPWNLTNSDVATSGPVGVISSYTDDEITMISGTTENTLAEPSALTDGGSAFTVTWEHAS